MLNTAHFGARVPHSSLKELRWGPERAISTGSQSAAPRDVLGELSVLVRKVVEQMCKHSSN